MLKILRDKRRLINGILPFVGIAIAVLYIVCGKSCLYLKGFILNIDIEYLGILYMATLVIFNFLGRGLILLALISFGMGAELYLIGFQIKNATLCYYCILFGAIVMLLFLLNFEKTKKAAIVVFLVIGFIVFALLFEGETIPVYAADFILPSFGNGQIEVRLYTDYFCGPCRSLEPQLEPLIIDLVRRGIISIKFIDTPIHKETILYARYFLYILNERNEFIHAIRARSILFEAAKEGITEEEKLESFLKKKGIRFKPFDTKLAFNTLNRYLKEDKINETPVCVVFTKEERKKYTGPSNIIKALKGLR